ncbi:MAG: hypothetical protein APR54_08400 [Candidatus Cloacimonas sp. SDB]|nr:MAG: hypothetical protein APR54_08400 [Candidatus Cloacimonas sp. SDB]
MFENTEEVKELNQFENNIASKSNISTQYAFSVIITEEEYRKLIKLCINNVFFRISPEKYPWCHIKLLTETYVRIVQNTNIQTTHTSEELSRFLNFQTPEIPPNIWDKFPNSLKKLNLVHTRDEGGPWSIVANIRLHAGIPKSRLHEIVEFLKKNYKKYSNLNEAITYLSSFSSIIENMHFSKYVKEAFTEHRTRKMLFSWSQVLKVGVNSNLIIYSFH